MKKLISLLLAGALALGLAACGKEEQGPEPAREQGDIQGAIDNLLGEESGEEESVQDAADLPQEEDEISDPEKLIEKQFDDFTYVYHENASFSLNKSGAHGITYEPDATFMIMKTTIAIEDLTLWNAAKVLEGHQIDIEKRYKSAEYSEIEEFKIGGVQAYSFTADLIEGQIDPFEGDYKTEYVTFLVNGRVYCMWYFARPGLYDTYYDMYRTSLESIKPLEDNVVEPVDTAMVVNWRSGSMFKVGEDIPAGEYYLEATGSRWAYMCVSSDASGELGSIVTNENFNGQLYITVDEGQYLELSGGRLAPAEEVETSFDPYALGEGMYKVGKDIPAGEYQLTNESDLYGYVCVYNSSYLGLYSIATNDNFEDSKYISVSEGQYLYLSGSAGTLKE